MSSAPQHIRHPDRFSISFGGFKQSGIGREGGTEGMYPYLEAKTIILDQRVPKP